SGPRSGSAGFSSGLSSWTYVLNQPAMVLRYLSLSIWPTGLVIHYGRPIDRALLDVWPQAAAIGALLIVASVALVRWPRAGFLGAWIVLTLAPASSVVPIATEGGAERRMYLPLMAVVACGVFAAYHLAAAIRLTSRRIAMISLAAVALALTAGTWARNREYG